MKTTTVTFNRQVTDKMSLSEFKKEFGATYHFLDLEKIYYDMYPNKKKAPKEEEAPKK